MRKLHRKSEIGKDIVRRGLAKRLSFIGPGFEVLIDGQAIEPGDSVRSNKCEKNSIWRAEDLPRGNHFGDGLTATDRIDFLSTTSQSERGIDIFAHGKSAASWSTHTQFARVSLVDEIRGEKKTKNTIRETKFDVWLEGHEPREQRAANRIVELLGDDENLGPKLDRPLLEVVKGSTEHCEKKS